LLECHGGLPVAKLFAIVSYQPPTFQLNVSRKVASKAAHVKGQTPLSPWHPEKLPSKSEIANKDEPSTVRPPPSFVVGSPSIHRQLTVEIDRYRNGVEP